MSTRVMSGIEDLHGQTTANGLRVELLVSRRPVVWLLRCTRCGSSWNEPHITVRHAPCRNVNCRLERERQQAQEQVRQRYLSRLGRYGA